VVNYQQVGQSRHQISVRSMFDLREVNVCW
jgi:hypothetical protein